ncbi:hypothetical protein BH09MYX1_BH09MYX1_46700 [soil metagenome]
MPMRSLFVILALASLSTLCGCEAGYRVEGAVVDPSGSPIAGAEVSVLSDHGHPVRSGTTDGNGHFHLHGTGAVDEGSVLQIRAPGRDPRTYSVSDACYRSFGHGDLGEPCPNGGPQIEL